MNLWKSCHWDVEMHLHYQSWKFKNKEILIAAPIETMNLTELRKMRDSIREIYGISMCFYLKKQTGIQFLRWWKKEFLLYGKIIRYTFLLWGYFCKEMNTENRSVVLSFHFNAEIIIESLI